MQQKVFQTAIVLATTALLFTACADAPKGDAATVTAAKDAMPAATGETFRVDTAASTIRFIGNGVGKNHPGTFHLANGALSVAGGTVTDGNFTIDMTSLQVAQPEEMFQTKLKGHLASPDFFDVANWNTAKFEITDVKPYVPANGDSSVVDGANYLVSGNFTLKDTTQNISFPARVGVTDNALVALANFDINRTQWGMRYGNDKSLGDKFISETVNIQMNLKAVQ